MPGLTTRRSIDYDGRMFRSVENTANGVVDADTLFHYHQRDNIVWATYGGGGVSFGTLVATVDESGCLDMRYAHVAAEGELMTGTCRTTPEILADGRIRLHERWQWTSGDRGKGVSVVEEVVPAED